MGLQVIFVLITSFGHRHGREGEERVGVFCLADVNILDNIVKICGGCCFWEGGRGVGFRASQSMEQKNDGVGTSVS